MTDSALHVVQIEQLDPRLGRQIVHDEASRRFAHPVTVDKAAWQSRFLRTYDPRPNPRQEVGTCTGVNKCVQLNTVGHRVKGVVLTMDDALRVYSAATKIDPWPGSWPPDDTGSSGLASCKAAQALGLGGEYRWLFGADECVQAVLDGWPVGVGTRWYAGGFSPQSRRGLPLPVVEMTGAVVGGHEWTLTGFDVELDMFRGRCWWGSFKDFLISRQQVADLLGDDGDAHVQERTQPA